jgi:hypothetical protein
MIKRTTTPENFIVECERAIDGLRAGRAVGMSAHIDPSTGLGRVNVTTADGQDVEDEDLPAFDVSDLETESSKADTAPGKGQKREPS